MLGSAQRRKRRLNSHEITIEDHDTSMSQPTDERTDGRLAVAIPRYALQRRAVKTISCWFNAVNPLTPTVAIRVQL